MEIRLCKIHYDSLEGKYNYNFIDELTIEQFDHFNISMSSINELINIRQLVKLVEHNEADFISFLNLSLEEYLKKNTKRLQLKMEDSEEKYLNINRFFLNYLSSIRTFIDHSQTFFNRKFGIKSFQLEEFKRICSVFFDESFAYRFFSKLRNYAQHVGLPIGEISFSTKIDRDNKKLEANLTVAFVRDELLLKFSDWGKVKNELKEKEKEFDVIPLIYEMTNNIEEIERQIEIICKEEFLKSAAFILDMTKDIRDKESEIVIVHSFNREDLYNMNFSEIHIPFKIIDALFNELNPKT